MALVKLLEGCHIALSGLLCQRVVRFLLRLGFGCGHVFVLGQATRDFIFSCSFATITTSPRLSKERQPFPSAFPKRALARRLVALNAGVMRRFKRVVALPDPKDVEFSQPQQCFS
jgi:hypothetical protein